MSSLALAGRRGGQTDGWTDEGAVCFTALLAVLLSLVFGVVRERVKQNFDLGNIFMLIHSVSHFHDKDGRKSRIRYRICRAILRL